MDSAEVTLKKTFSGAINSVDPAKLVAAEAERVRAIYSEGKFSRLLVIAIGKAAVPMATSLHEQLGDLIADGIALSTYGGSNLTHLGKISFREAGHPIPDSNGLEATETIISLAKGADEHTLTVVALSGGASALLVAPADGISLEEKQSITSLLLKAGAGIRELNAVRKHLSRVKGGNLAQLLQPATIVSLILSDVVGDPLDVIASGPTAADPTTFADALAVLDKYGIRGLAPRSVINRLINGEDGLVAETPKPGAPLFGSVSNRIIGSNRMALASASQSMRSMGLNVELLPEPITGEAREAGKTLAQKAVAAKKGREANEAFCLISGGETTVTVTGSGIGGRNLELALAFALEIENMDGITLLSAGTDGIDGFTDAAGAIVDGNTVARGKAMGADATEYLANNDSYSFFRKAGGLLITGPTGTNVMDVQMILIQ